MTKLKKCSKWIKIYDKYIKTKLECKLNEDTMAKKQKSEDEEDEEPTPLLDHAAARLVKTLKQSKWRYNG